MKTTDSPAGTITLSNAMGILESLFRGGPGEWTRSQATGLVVPRSLRDVDSVLFQPEKLFIAVDFESRQRALNWQRAELMDKYPELDQRIKAVFQTKAAAVGQFV